MVASINNSVLSDSVLIANSNGGNILINGNSNNTNSNGNTPSRQTLEETPSRAYSFLRTAGTNPSIRASLQAVGYSQEEHAEGWRLVVKVADFGDEVANDAGNPVVRAMSTVEEWQASGFARARAALRRKHPEQEQFVFAGDLAPARGPEAVAFMTVFLDRCETLKNGNDRKATRKADHAALATLAKRGITEAVLYQLRELVQLASTEANAMPTEPEAIMKRNEDLLALYRWLEDWTDTARAVLSRRDERIRLGIARRRPRKKTAAVVVTTPPAVTSPQQPQVPGDVATPPAAGGAGPVFVPPVVLPPPAPPIVTDPATMTSGLPIIQFEERGPDSRRAA